MKILLSPGVIKVKLLCVKIEVLSAEWRMASNKFSSLQINTFKEQHNV